jgi:hypothetical protein
MAEEPFAIGCEAITPANVNDIMRLYENHYDILEASQAARPKTTRQVVSAFSAFYNMNNFLCAVMIRTRHGEIASCLPLVHLHNDEIYTAYYFHFVTAPAFRRLGLMKWINDRVPGYAFSYPFIEMLVAEGFESEIFHYWGKGSGFHTVENPMNSDGYGYLSIMYRGEFFKSQLTR